MRAVRWFAGQGAPKPHRFYWLLWLGALRASSGSLRISRYDIISTSPNPRLPERMPG